MQKCKSLFQQIFIVYKRFTVGIKTKNLPITTRFGLWSFYKGVLQDKHLPKTTVFEESQEWSSYTGLTVVSICTIPICTNKYLSGLESP